MLSVIDAAIKQFTQNNDAYIRLGELAALICAIVAVIYARKQYGDSRNLIARAREQTDKLESVAKDLGFVASALPTRYVGKFPNNMSELTTLVHDAKHELLILVDFVGYGHYSDPRGFKRYYLELQRQAINLDVNLTIVCYDHFTSSQRAKDQFEKRHDFATETASEPFAEFYTKRFKEEFPTPPTDWDTFTEHRLKCEEGYRRDLHIDKVKMFETSEYLPFLAWIRDNEEAIISLQSITAFGDVVFRTADKEFVQFFRDQVLNIPGETLREVDNAVIGRLIDQIASLTLSSAAGSACIANVPKRK